MRWLYQLLLGLFKVIMAKNSSFICGYIYDTEFLISYSYLCLEKGSALPMHTLKIFITSHLWMTICHQIVTRFWRLTFMVNESAAQRLTFITDPQFHFVTAISLKVDWVGPTGKRTILKFERSPRTCLGPQAMFACPLNPLYSHSAKRHMERNWGVIIEML